MSLSFRERAAIANYTTPTPIHENGAPASDSAEMAQELADACCAQWGHDWAPFYLEHAGAMTIAAGGIPQDHARCRRCGAERHGKDGGR